ncbi:MAG TPA: class I tRNA ligase family protein, partial [Thermoplasmataceae archaeon]|nr:class I tRNA ligase family protein [Thermoplasmataceae archaeon]
MDIDTKALEDKWKKFWFQNKLFSLSDFSLPRERYFTIDTPPPTVSGKMHIGHAFSYSHQDFIARYKRMRGFLVFYPWGFDDNGLPTERFTESERGVKAENIEPKVFVEMCRETSEMAEKRLRENWRSLGITADLDNNYRTISPESQKISQLMFKDLLKKGRVYRDEAPTIRCPTCLTAISQIELKDKELETDFVYVKFEGKAGGITIATTRPELIGACVAVAVNPSDARYAGLIGSLVLVPIYGREVPVIGDDIVDKEKGTGAEMICTFGDQNDVAVWRAHSLDTRVIIDRFGRITDDGDFLKGLHVKEARRRMIRELSERGLIVKMERIRHSVN